jgi:hypothetical protein
MSAAATGVNAWTPCDSVRRNRLDIDSAALGAS